MNQLLLFLHFVGLMLGATGGFGSAIIMRRALVVPPEAVPAMRALGPVLARVSETGLALMWLSGIVMVWSAWGGPGNLPSLFWLKMVFVLSLTAATVGIRAIYGQIAGGRPEAAARLPKLGPIAGSSALLAVLTAVFTFNP